MQYRTKNAIKIKKREIWIHLGAGQCGGGFMKGGGGALGNWKRVVSGGAALGGSYVGSGGRLLG